MYYVVNMNVLPDNLPPFVPLGNGTFTLKTMIKFHGDKELTTCTTTSVSYRFENEFKGSQKPNKPN